MNGNKPPAEGWSFAWRRFRQPLSPEDIEYVECTPDLQLHDPLELDPDAMAALGVKHLLFDLDGTLVSNSPAPGRLIIEPFLLAHLHRLYTDERFASLSLATNNRRFLDEVALQIGENIRVFQPTSLGDDYEETFKHNPRFYELILAELGCSDTPQAVVMIGDSRRYDILPAQQMGMKTVLVDRLQRELSRA